MAGLPFPLDGRGASAPTPRLERQPFREAPSLQEIAALPGAGVAAIYVRRHYDPHFARDTTEDPRAAHLWRVRIEYSETNHKKFSVELRADTEELAEKIAKARFYDEASAADIIDIDEISIDEIGH